MRREKDPGEGRAMSPRCKQRVGSESGAVLVHVGAALIALLAVGALAVDYGVRSVARRQAQNAADAAAFAAAYSLALDDPEDLERARVAAEVTGERNWIIGQPPNIDPALDVSFPSCPPGAPGFPDTCVRVNVYRNRHRDPLPTFFARVVGVSSQGVQAMAIAQVTGGNASSCLKPFAIPDKWVDNRDVTGQVDSVWTWDDRYERYYESGPKKGQLLPEPRDEYIPPSESSPGSGFRFPDDYGSLVVLKTGDPSSTITAGWYFPIDLPRAGSPDPGGARYRENIASCNGVPVGIGDVLWNEPGNMVGPTKQGIQALIDKDPGAYWADGIKGSCAPSCATVSPRLVGIPIFNVDAWATGDKASGRFTFTVTNILGFFLDGIDGNGDVTGHLMNYPGQVTDRGNLNEQSAFLRTVILVR